MRSIIIGAGRGSRLKALTEMQPKCYASIGGRRIVDWTLEAFSAAGLDRTVFIGGYQIDMIRCDYPQLTYCHNSDWPDNNILISLMYAEHYMDDGFVCAYSDTLFRDTVVQVALQHEGDIVLCVDTDWRNRYAHRTHHTEDDAEKVITDGDRVTHVERDICADEADGEYIGVAKFSAKGASLLREHFHRNRKMFGGKLWRGAKVFEKAYLILLLQDMIEQGVDIRMVATDGDYMEIDTEQDYELANRDWIKRFANNI